ncbi:MAG: beta-galactosidase [Kiritimatiellae bacterium]|nr:beta-galactosidase [Kiritimatiellia bacterium]
MITKLRATVRARRRLRVWPAVWVVACGAGMVFGAAGAAGEGGTNLLANGGFEYPVGWEVALEDGAGGAHAREAACVRGGSCAMRLTKTNGLGWIRLRTTAPIRVESNTTYYYRAYFHAEDAPFGSSMLFLRVGDREGNLGYDASLDAAAGYSSQSFLINSPPGQWEKRVMSFRRPVAGDVYLHAVLHGNPCTVWLDDVELTTQPFVRQTPKHVYNDPFTADEVLRRLEERPNAEAKIETRGGAARLSVNGEVTPPIVFKGLAFSETAGDYANFAQDGIHLSVVGLRLGGDFIWPPRIVTSEGIWRGKDRYDFSIADRTLLGVLRRNPAANLIVDMIIYPYPEWGDEHPDDCVKNSKGETGWTTYTDIEGFATNLLEVKVSRHYVCDRVWGVPSLQSDTWRRDAAEAVRRVVEHIRESPYGKAVVGYYVSGGHDGQFIQPPGDYSPCSVGAFRQWCQTKYGDIGALNRAWNTQHASFAAVGPPRRDEPDSEAVLERLPPYVLGAAPDFAEFKDQQTWSVRDYFAGVIKQAAGKPVIALCYGSPAARHFLDSKHLDAAGMMSYYPYRQPGYAAGWHWLDTFALHRKLLFQELDTRSWVNGSSGEIYDIWVGTGFTPTSWATINRKLIGTSLAHGYGYWYYDMNSFFHDPAIHQEIAASRKIAAAVMAERDDFRPDVCFVRSDLAVGGGDNRFLHEPRFNANLYAQLYGLCGMMRESSAVPFHTHLLQDVLANRRLQNYRVYVFEQSPFITSAERARIARRLQRGGRTLVWLHDTGYLSETGPSAEAMSGLIGMDVRTEPAYARGVVQMLADAHPLTQGVQPFGGLCEMVMAMMTLRGSSAFTTRCQPFWIEDSAAVPLARYAENGRTAIAVRQFPNWTSVYVSAPSSLGDDLLNNIARAAGAYVAGPPGQVALQMNGRFLSVHGLRTCAYEFRLPPGRRQILDADTGVVLAKGVTSYTIPIRAQETKWFLLR